MGTYREKRVGMRECAWFCMFAVVCKRFDFITDHSTAMQSRDLPNVLDNGKYQYLTASPLTHLSRLGAVRTSTSCLTASINRLVSFVVEKLPNVPRAFKTISAGKLLIRFLYDFLPVLSRMVNNSSNMSKISGFSGPS